LIREIDRSIIVSLFILTFYLAIFSFYALTQNIYFGPSTGLLLIVLPWLVLRKRFNLAFFCLILIFAGGKRAVMVGALVEVVLLSFLFGRSLNLKEILYKLITYSVVLLIASYCVSYILGFNVALLNDFLDLVSFRILGSFEGFTDNPDKVSAGRISEVIESFAIFTENIWVSLFGFGFGWYFYWNEEYLHYLHFSPINFLYQFGIINFSILMLLFIKIFYSIYKYNRLVFNDTYSVLFIIFIGQVVEGLFSYMYVVNPFMWCIFGLLIAMKKNKIKICFN
jgi:hypothetical protein